MQAPLGHSCFWNSSYMHLCIALWEHHLSCNLFSNKISKVSLYLGTFPRLYQHKTFGTIPLYSASPLCSSHCFNFRWCLTQMQLHFLLFICCLFPHEARFRWNHNGKRKDVCFYFDNRFAHFPVFFRLLLSVLTPKQQLSSVFLRVVSCCFSNLSSGWNMQVGDGTVSPGESMVRF